MIPITINNRPFASDFITGLMLPDGIFEASIGRLQLNAHFTNGGNAALANLNFYAESASHPGILITPATRILPSLAGGASSLQQWDLDISNAPAGKHYISFIAENATGRQRIIQRIFVTRVDFNAADQTFSITCPEGKLTVSVKEVYTSKDSTDNCDCKKGRKRNDQKPDELVHSAMRLLKQVQMNDLKDCPPQTILIKSMSMGVTYTPGFEGQYGDLPFQDPWWKTLLIILAIILFITAVVVAAVFGAPLLGAGAIAVGATIACCSVPFFVAVGAAAGALTSAILAGETDVRDPMRRGQDKTMPGTGEITIGESLDVEFDYIEPIELGKPYAIGTKWKYNRHTLDAASVARNYPYEVAEVNNNVHVLSRYEIDAPDVVKVYLQKEKPFIVRAKFYDKNEKLMKGDQLFVKCFLQRKSDNKIISFLLQDNGSQADAASNDGTYTARYLFSADDDGFWKMYVIAQDINNAQPNMTPDEAAQIIGGQILTNQLTVNYSGGTCPFVPDGDLHVIG